jgi:hypothetical protein
VLGYHIDWRIPHLINQSIRALRSSSSTNHRSSQGARLSAAGPFWVLCHAMYAPDPGQKKAGRPSGYLSSHVSVLREVPQAPPFARARITSHRCGCCYPYLQFSISNHSTHSRRKHSYKPDPQGVTVTLRLFVRGIAPPSRSRMCVSSRWKPK